MSQPDTAPPTATDPDTAPVDASPEDASTDDEVSAVPAAADACPTCGEEVHGSDRWCEACGGELDGTSTAAASDTDGATSEGPHDASAEPAEPCPACGVGAIVAGWCDSCGVAAPDPRDHVEVDHGTVAVVSDVGHHHHRNEDAFAVHVSDDGAAVLVVCDGVSSTIHPERASAAAAQAALEVLRATPTDLVAAHAAAQAAVVAVPAPPHADLGNPSCTFLGASWDPSAGLVHLGGLGDCRAYLVPDDPRHDAKALTLDDSWAHEAIAAGGDPELVADDPMAGAITRWLGRDADPSWTPSLTEHVVTEPGHLVVCSDGLWKYVPEPAALRAVMPDGTPLTRAAGLVRVALDAGGQDNITVAVLRVGPATPSPTSQEPST